MHALVLSLALIAAVSEAFVPPIPPIPLPPVPTAAPTMPVPTIPLLPVPPAVTLPVARCPTEVNTSAALCDAVTAATDTCGVLYTGTADGQSPPSAVNCLIRRSIRIECSSAAPALMCPYTTKPCFYLDHDNRHRTRARVQSDRIWIRFQKGKRRHHVARNGHRCHGR